MSCRAPCVLHMKTYHIPFRESIAGRLVIVLTAVYVLITIVLTTLQVGAEFRIVKNAVLEELHNMGNAVSSGLAAALYSVDEEQVAAILSGLEASNSIMIVRVQRQFQPDITIGHLHSSQDAATAPSSMNDTDFQVTIPLKYAQLDGDTVKVGVLTLQSSAQIVFGKVRSGLFAILMTSAIKLLCVCLVIFLLGKRLVSRPLEEMTQAVTKVSMETPEC